MYQLKHHKYIIATTLNKLLQQHGITTATNILKQLKHAATSQKVLLLTSTETYSNIEKMLQHDEI